MIQILYTELNCNDQSMLKIIYLIKNILNLIGIVIPIILIIWCLWDSIQNMISQNGWDQKIIKKIINKFIAAVLAFMIPTIINFVLDILGENGYQVGTCWKEATKEGVKNAEQSDIGFSENIIKAGETIIDLRKQLAESWGKK